MELPFTHRLERRIVENSMTAAFDQRHRFRLPSGAYHDPKEGYTLLSISLRFGGIDRRRVPQVVRTSRLRPTRRRRGTGRGCLLTPRRTAWRAGRDCFSPWRLGYWSRNRCRLRPLIRLLSHDWLRRGRRCGLLNGWHFCLSDFFLDARFFRCSRFLHYDGFLRLDRFLGHDRFLRHGQNLRGRFVFHELHLSLHFLRLGQRVPSGSRIDPELRCHSKEKSPSEEERTVKCD